MTTLLVGQALRSVGSGVEHDAVADKLARGVHLGLYQAAEFSCFGAQLVDLPTELVDARDLLFVGLHAALPPHNAPNCEGKQKRCR